MGYRLRIGRLKRERVAKWVGCNWIQAVEALRVEVLYAIAQK